MLISKRAGVKSDKPAYKEKEKSESGNDIYRYDEKHIKKRWDLKKDKLKKLEKEIDKVRKQYREDLKSDDERTRAIAAIVGIMDDTSMRIGNEESAKEGTFGASTLKVKHVKGGSGNMTFDFPGKGAIEQNVVLKNNEVIKAVRDLMKGKKANDFIFEVDGKKIWDRAVNRYLKPLGISAKDLRGFHSNRLMKETLKKKDWKDALEEVAEIVGHEMVTLKNQYLDPDLVEKHEGKEKDKKDKEKKKDKKAEISIRALEIGSPGIQEIPEGQDTDPEISKSRLSDRVPKPNPQYEDVTKDITSVDLNRNVQNVQGDIGNYPDLQTAWKIIAPFLPDGARITSGWRSDNEQAKIILEYWLSGIWVNGVEDWRQDRGFFLTNFPEQSKNKEELRWWLGKARKSLPISGKRYRQLNRDIEPLRKIMTSYKPKGIQYEPPKPLEIAKLGTSKHLTGQAIDVSGVSLWSIMSAARYVTNIFPQNINFSDIRKEDAQHAVHLTVEPGVSMPSQQIFAKALADYKAQSKVANISKRSLLKPQDERFVSRLEEKYFGKASTQQPIGKERSIRSKLSISSRVKLNETILASWVILKPHLPEGSKLTSGSRTYEDQVRIINDYWGKSGLNNRYPGVTDPYERSKKLINNGWIVGPPTTKKKNMHLTGRALDVSGANLNEIANAARKVSKDSRFPVTFSQVLVEDKNNAVHVGIASVIPLAELMNSRRASSELMLSKSAKKDIEEETKDQVSSIYEDLLKSNPPDDVLEEYTEAFGDMLAGDKDKEEADISVRQKVALDLDELQRDMGVGIEDEPGDYFEKSQIFLDREEVPEYDIDADKNEASKLANDDPEKFFYRGLHKEYPELEVKALKNMLEDNSKFYWVFKYHEKEEPEFKELAQPAAEALSQQDPRAFFYYHLHKQWPELGRGAVVQIIDTNPDSFFDLGLQTSYPDYEEAAGNARNIKDPHKVELEKPEWIDGEPISLRDLNVAKSKKLSSRAEVETLYGVGEDLDVKLRQLVGFGVDSPFGSGFSREEGGMIQYAGKFPLEQGIDIVWQYTFFPEFVILNQEIDETDTVQNVYKTAIAFVTGPESGYFLFDEIYRDPHEAFEELRRDLYDTAWLKEEIEDTLKQFESEEQPDEQSEPEEEVGQVIPFPKKSMLSKRAIEPMSDEGTPMRTSIIPSSQEAEKQFEEKVEQERQIRKDERDYNANPLDENFDQQVDLRKPEPFDVVRYFLFKHYRRDRYRAHNPEMIRKLLEIQPSKFFDSNLFSEKEFELYTGPAVEATARLEPQYFIESLSQMAPKDVIMRYIDVAKESLKDGKSLEERREELMDTTPLSDEEYKKILVPPKEGLSKRDLLISKQAGKLDYPKKMAQEIYDWAMEVSKELKKQFILFGKPKRKRISKLFDIDLSDTEQFKKKPELNGLLRMFQGEGWHAQVLVIMYSDDEKDMGAAYRSPASGMHEIEIYGLSGLFVEKTLMSSILHELTHMTQDILRSFVWESSQGQHVGLPGKYEKEKHKMYNTVGESEKEKNLFGYVASVFKDFMIDLSGQLGEEDIKHVRSDVEFFPRLNQEIYEMGKYISGAKNYDDMVKRFKTSIKHSTLLEYLKNYDEHRYQKTIRELYRAFDEIASPVRPALSPKRLANISKRATNPLSTYKKKRDFEETAEPEGKVEGKNQHRFVIQDHKATKHHWDLRVENDDGAMSSWALPKNKLPSGSEKLLAIKVEDHPVSYNKFKGEIPEGEYGAGKVDIHDSGKYEEIERSSSKIVFKLSGKKEKGTYNLFKTDGKKWMIMEYKGNE